MKQWGWMIVAIGCWSLAVGCDADLPPDSMGVALEVDSEEADALLAALEELDPVHLGAELTFMCTAGDGSDQIGGDTVETGGEDEIANLEEFSSEVLFARAAPPAAGRCVCEHVRLLCETPSLPGAAATCDTRNCIIRMPPNRCKALGLESGDLIRTFPRDRHPASENPLTIISACMLNHELAHGCDGPSRSCTTEQNGASTELECLYAYFKDLGCKSTSDPRSICQTVVNRIFGMQVWREMNACRCKNLDNKTQVDCKAQCEQEALKVADPNERAQRLAACRSMSPLVR